MTTPAIALIVIVVAILLLAYRRADRGEGECQSQSHFNGGDAAESSNLTQKYGDSGRDIQNYQTETALSDVSYLPVLDSQKKGEDAKESSATSMSTEDDDQHKDRLQLPIDGDKRGLTFKTFEELEQYLYGQDNAVPRPSSRTSKTPPNLGRQRAHGVQEPRIRHPSTKTRWVKPSKSWKNDTQKNIGGGFCPLDPAIYVLGQPNIRNHRSKRYARKRVTFWR